MTRRDAWEQLTAPCDCVGGLDWQTVVLAGCIAAVFAAVGLGVTVLQAMLERDRLDSLVLEGMAHRRRP